MNTLWRKLYFDLFEQCAHTCLSIISIAIGLFAVGTLYGMIDLQLSAMDTAHRAAKPAHINIILNTPIASSTLNSLRTLPNVDQLEPMNQTTVRFKTRPDEPWRLASVVMRNDFNQQNLDLMTRIWGDWPSTSSLSIERLSAMATGISLGDTISLDTHAGILELPITGVIRHPFVKPPAFGGQMHFFANAETLARLGIPRDHFRQLLISVTAPYSIEKARQVAEAIRTRLGQESIGIAMVLLQDPELHWGRPFVAGINQVLKVMALAALGLSAVLVLNTVSAQLTQQTDQIGIMKAIGASRGMIATHYLSEILILGLTACLLALPTSILTANATSQWLLNLFNIELTHITISWRAVALMLTGGIVVPLAAAIGPIWRAVSLSSREAMNRYGVGADFGCSYLDRWIERLIARFLPTFYAAALGNLFRRKVRLALTQLVLVTAGVMFLIVMSLKASVNLTLDQEMARSNYDVRIGLATPTFTDILTKIIAPIATVNSVEFWARSPAALTANGKPLNYAASLGSQVVALPAATSLYRPMITAGRWLKASDEGQYVIVLSAETAVLNQLNIGDRLNLSFPGTPPHTWTIIGLYRWIAGSRLAVESSYAPLATLRSISGQASSASQILVSANVNSLAEEQKVSAAIKTALENAGVKLDFYSTSARREQREIIDKQFRPVLSTLLGLASMIASVGGIGLSGALSISVMQRRSEIGILRAIGAPFRSIFSLFVLEGVLQAAISWCISVPLAFFLAKPLAQALGQLMFNVELEYEFNQTAVWLWLILVLMIGMLGSLTPARSAARLTVHESLSHQ